MICAFKVAVEEFGFYDVMNIKSTFTFSLLAFAALAYVAVTLSRLAFLATPVWPIVVYMAAIVVWIAITAHPHSVISITAFRGAEVATAKPDLMSSCFVFLAARLTYSCYMDFWLYSTWLRLACSKFRATLIGAKARLAVSPFFKLLTTPLTNKDGMLGWIRWYPSISKPTLFAAVMDYIFLAFDHFKWAVTIATIFGYSILAIFPITFTRTIFTSAFYIPIGGLKFDTTVLTSNRRHLSPLVDVASGFSSVGGSLSRGSGFRAVALAP